MTRDRSPQTGWDLWNHPEPPDDEDPLPDPLPDPFPPETDVPLPPFPPQGHVPAGQPAESNSTDVEWPADEFADFDFGSGAAGHAEAVMSQAADEPVDAEPEHAVAALPELGEAESEDFTPATSEGVGEGLDTVEDDQSVVNFSING